MMTARKQGEDTREDLLKVFKLFDDDKTGTVSFKNLKRVCQELGENMTDDELKEMMDWADKDGDGVLNEDEFINAVMRKKTKSTECIEAIWLGSLRHTQRLCRWSSLKQRQQWIRKLKQAALSKQPLTWAFRFEKTQSIID